MSRFYIAFDDTDNLETLGTGHMLARFLGSLPLKTGHITRHQLFVDERVPFTSHNSAMCAWIEGEVQPEELIAGAAAFLEAGSAPGSDPGLCLACEDELRERKSLEAWGWRAKREVLSKEAAFELACRCNVHLSEHGGDGQGVVGALAAVGLRLSGNDGRVRGKVMLDAQSMTVGQLLASTGFDRVCTEDGTPIQDDRIVRLGSDGVKAIWRDNAISILVQEEPDGLRLLSKQQLKRY